MSLENFKKQILPIKNKLFRFSLRIVGNPSEAEDVVQEVFIKMWKSREKWHQYNNIEAWCMRMTKNLSIDKLRSKHQKVGFLPEGMDFIAPNSSPEKRTELKDSVLKIKDLIKGLPEKQRMVIHLRDLEGFTYKEIAEQLDIPLNQVKVYLFRARQSIKSQMINIDSYGI